MCFNGKNKLLTFSFDDGNIDDIRLVEILNKYGLKGTFNLCSGSLTYCDCWRYCNVKDVRHINFTEHSDLYDGHEIACHSYTHPHLEELDDGTLYNQIALDKKLLEFMFSEDIVGMAYPFGTYNDKVVEALEKCGIKYSRTIKATNDFSFPQNPLLWHPTCHFRSDKLEELTEKFLNSNPNEPQLFYIWGHSYELVTEEDWQEFESFCQKISGKDDIYYCTNREVLEL